MLGPMNVDFDVWQSRIDASLECCDMFSEMSSEEWVLRFGYDVSANDPTLASDSSLDSPFASDSTPNPTPNAILSPILEPQTIESAISSVMASTCVQRLPAKRGRGRPRIDDPVVKAQHKVISQRKAAKKYRSKQKQILLSGEEVIERLEDYNSQLRLGVIACIDSCETLMKKCLKLDGLNDQQRQRLNDLPQLLIDCQQVLN